MGETLEGSGAASTILSQSGPGSTIVIHDQTNLENDFQNAFLTIRGIDFEGSASEPDSDAIVTLYPIQDLHLEHLVLKGYSGWGAHLVGGWGYNALDVVSEGNQQGGWWESLEGVWIYTGTSTGNFAVGAAVTQDNTGATGTILDRALTASSTKALVETITGTFSATGIIRLNSDPTDTYFSPIGRGAYTTAALKMAQSKIENNTGGPQMYLGTGLDEAMVYGSEFAGYQDGQPVLTIQGASRPMIVNNRFDGHSAATSSYIQVGSTATRSIGAQILGNSFLLENDSVPAVVVDDASPGCQIENNQVSFSDINSAQQPFQCTGGMVQGDITPASTIGGVSVACLPATVQAGQASQCTATVTGTGNYSPAVTWSAKSGTITANGVYTAPAAVPSSGNDTVTALSAQDASQSGSALLLLPADPASGPACYPIASASGGDDCALINAALLTNRCVQLGAGRFSCGTPITNLRMGDTLEGTGVASTILSQRGPGSTIVIRDQTNLATDQQNGPITIRDISFRGSPYEPDSDAIETLYPIQGLNLEHLALMFYSGWGAHLVGGWGYHALDVVSEANQQGGWWESLEGVWIYIGTSTGNFAVGAAVTQDNTGATGTIIDSALTASSTLASVETITGTFSATDIIRLNSNPTHIYFSPTGRDAYTTPGLTLEQSKIRKNTGGPQMYLGTGLDDVMVYGSEFGGFQDGQPVLSIQGASHTQIVNNRFDAHSAATSSYIQVGSAASPSIGAQILDNSFLLENDSVPAVVVDDASPGCQIENNQVFFSYAHPTQQPFQCTGGTVQRNILLNRSGSEMGTP